MNLFKPTALSQEQIERRKRIQAQGRKHYILYHGVLGWGESMFILSTLWDWHDKFGWHLPAPKPELFLDVSFGLLVCSITGYFWGAYMWRKMNEKSIPQD
jgi:hypothetical protein